MSQILVQPIITEKALGKIADGVYVFEVAKNANKPQIAQAITDFYKVKVERINVLIIKSEKRLVRGRFLAQKKAWKKAVITLKKGQKIPGFEDGK